MQLDHNAPGNLMSAMATEDAPTPTCTGCTLSGTRRAVTRAPPALDSLPPPAHDPT